MKREPKTSAVEKKKETGNFTCKVALFLFILHGVPCLQLVLDTLQEAFDTPTVVVETENQTVTGVSTAEFQAAVTSPTTPMLETISRLIVM